jgi:hypothetical protein
MRVRSEWRHLFSFIGMFGVALFILGAAFIRNPAPIAHTAEGATQFFLALAKGFFEVAKTPHVWIAAAFGAMCFGTMLGLGVVWAPKLLGVRGFDVATANWSTSLLWLIADPPPLKLADIITGTVAAALSILSL